MSIPAALADAVISFSQGDNDAATEALFSANPLSKVSKIAQGVRKGVSSGTKGLPDSAVVCRGGLCTADRFAKGSGVRVNSQGKLSGVSVNSAQGKSIQELSQSIPNKNVGATTVGDVRKAGGNVTLSPTVNNPTHCILCGISPQKAEALFTPTILNQNF